MKQPKKAIPIVIIVVFFAVMFSSLFPNIGEKYFAAGGDGLKAYYCAWYHALYDTSPGHFNGMNYPWGESVYFTDSQPPISNTIRFVHQSIAPVSHCTPAIFNVLMLLSVLLGAVFLYLIFRKFKLPAYYSVFVAIAVTLLSPQMGRLNGHFSLAWAMWIPLMIYLLIVIVEKPGWLKSSVFGLVLLFASFMHMYFFMFAAALLSVYWFNRLFIQKEKKRYLIEAAHFLIQIVVPFIIIQVVMYDSHIDRTMHPYGFFVYKAHPASVFLPLNKPYLTFLNEMRFVRHIEWEAYSYVGIVSAIAFVIIIVNLIRKYFSKKHLVFLPEGKAMNILFWSSFLLLLFSFGIPFIFGLEKLRTSIGFISQLRGLGRFAWLFYYAINIITWVMIYRWYKAMAMNKRIIAGIAVALLLIVQGFESYKSSFGAIKLLNNQIELLTDTGNQHEANRWVTEIDAQNYQAIMPLPYFHIGSESSWIDPRCGIDRQMFIVSLKTGLPCNGVMMGRTPLGQTYKNIALSRLPWQKYEVLDEYPNNKPLLLLVAKCKQLNTDELRLIKHSAYVTGNEHFDFYSLNIDTLKSIPPQYNYPARYNSMIDSIKVLQNHGAAFVEQNGGMRDVEMLKPVVVTDQFQRYFEAPVVSDTLQPLYIRFWVRDYAKDLHARCQMLVIISTPDHQTIEEKYTDFFRHFKTYNGEWALVEIEMQPKQEHQIIKLLFKNNDLNGTAFYFDDLNVSQIPL
jgi:hypothetical protein